MTATLAGPELFMRSHEPAWDEARWKELLADGNRYEVIDGVLYMTTAPSSFHQWISRQLVSELLPQVDGTGWGMVFYAPIGLFMPGCAPVQPDVLVVRVADRHFFQEGRIRGVPALIVEIESPGSMGYDNRTKREAYARAGVPEYWIVRPATRDVLICTRPDEAMGDFAQSQIVEQSETLVSPTLPVRIAVATLFAGAPDTSL